MNEKKLSRHPLVLLAFILALVVFILPTHSDLMFSATMAQATVTMAMVTAICFSAVMLPLICGAVLTSRQPGRWRKSKLAVATWGILALALLFNCFGWYARIKMTTVANQAEVGTPLPAAPHR